MTNPRKAPTRSTLILLTVAALAVFALVGSPAIRTQYYMWQFNHACAEQKRLMSILPRSRSQEQRIDRLFKKRMHYRERLMSIGRFVIFEYDLTHLKGNGDAFDRLHRDFAALAPNPPASCGTTSSEGRLSIVDLAENRSKWDAFAKARNTPEYASGVDLGDGGTGRPEQAERRFGK